MSTAGSATEPGAFAPLRERVFLVLWLATVAANTGTWMRDTASGWLMTSLAPSPTMVALVQAATTLPVFLLALPAGALADRVDRRRLMIVIQIGLGLVSLALGLLTAAGAIGPASLLALTFLGGVGAALVAPAWQSIVPELVPRPLLRPAVALNSLGVNISRAIGPALGGLLIAGLGTAAAYFADVLSYVLIVAALLWWRGGQAASQDPEPMLGAMRTGLRFALFHAELQRVLLRAVLFFTAASCYWALLPLVVRVQLRGDATAYGLAMTAIGAGAIAGALALPRLRRHLSANATLLLGGLITAAATALLALARTQPLAMAALLLAGAAWITVLTTLNGSAQTVLPNWVRGRGLALYLTAFFGAMTLGSAIWGQVAGAFGLGTALLAAALACALLALIGHRLPLPEGEADLTPSLHWPEPAVAASVEPDGGPVMVRIEYRVTPERHAEFRAAMEPLRRLRRRDGAQDWGLMFDLEDPGRVSEWFLVASWREHLRQHGRIAAADRAVQERVRALHQGPEPPRVEHWLDLRHSRLRGQLPQEPHADL